MDGRRDQQALIYAGAATAVLIVVGAITVRSLLHKNVNSASDNDKRRPPRVTGWPLVGSALEFGADCRAFLRKNFSQLQTPIFTAKIAGKDYHFVDPSYAEFSVERLFRCKAMSFRPMANDALMYGFGLPPDLVTRMNGPDGNSADLNAVYHRHMLTSEGLAALVMQAQDRLEGFVFCDATLYPSAQTPTTKPLHGLVQESLFRATIGAAISDSIVSPKDNPSQALQDFIDFDAKFPLLLSKIPARIFPKATKGRQAIAKRCQGPDFDAGISPMIRDRNELVASDKFGITNAEEIALMSLVLVWAAAANTIPTGFWLLFYLLQHKDTAYAAIQKEVVELFQSRKQKGPLSLAELDRLVGLDSALTETFRLCSESLMGRDVVEDFGLDLKIPGHPIFELKKDSRVAVMMSCLHMDEAVFPNATCFQWDRFVPDQQTGKPPVFTKNGKVLAQPVRPFGGGISMCPGRKFASYEIKAFVAELLYRYDLELVEPGKEVKTDPSRAGLGITAPLEDVDVRIKTRRK